MILKQGLAQKCQDNTVYFSPWFLSKVLTYIYPPGNLILLS